MLMMLSRLLGLLIGVACRIAAGAIHTQVRRLVTGAGDAPQATGQDHGWWVVPRHCWCQGAVSGVVQGASDRGAATRYRKFTRDMAR
jgi:hypothetical protein